MKNFWKILVLVLFLSFFNSQNVYSEDCPCDDPNCCEYEEYSYTLLVQYASCYCEVNISTCECQSSRYIVINWIKPLTSYCTNSLLGLWIRMSALKVLAEAYNIFEIPDQELRDGYSIYLKIASCYKFNWTQIMFEPCNTDKCCEIKYNLMNINGCPTVLNYEDSNLETCACSDTDPQTAYCSNACENITFPVDTCLKMDYGDCNWNCDMEDAGRFSGKYDSAMGQPVGIVEPWTFWSYKGPNDDTLCINFKEIVYNCGAEEEDIPTVLKRAIEITLWNAYIKAWGYDKVNTHYIRITMPACYRDIENFGEASKILSPCFGTCCSTIYTVKMEGNEIFVLNVDHDSNPDPQCGQPPYPCYISPCTSEIYDDVIPSPINPLKINGILNQEQIKSYVKPNPSKNSTDIYLISDEQGSYEISLYNTSGNEINKFNINKLSSEVKYRINTSNYANGLYHYSIVKNGVILFRGNFIISR